MRRDLGNRAKSIAAKNTSGFSEPRMQEKSAYRGGRGFAYNQKFAGEGPGAAEGVCGDGERE
jgi:hypothetical protein